MTCPLSCTRLCSLAIVVMVCAVTPAHAQAPDSRLELGIQLSWLRQSDLDTTPRGFGGRVSVDVSRWLAIEGEVTAYPHDDFTIDHQAPLLPDYGLTYRRSRLEGLFGARLGWRARRAGIFGKVRPGFTRLDDGGLGCEGPGCALILVARPVYRTEFALDVGGVFEFWAAPEAVVRLDVGDTIIRHRSLAPPCSACTTHNLTTRLGIGVRF